MNELPHSIGPEKSVLGSMLKKAAMFARAAAEGIGEDHFHLPAHRLLFREIRDRYRGGEEKQIDLVMLLEDMRRDGTLEDVGGPSYVSEVYTYPANDFRFDAHVAKLRSDLALRTGIIGALKIAEGGAAMEPEEIVNALSSALEGTVKALAVDSGVVTGKEAAARLAARLVAMQAEDAHIPGLPTALHPLDLSTGGMRPGELWVVAADTSGGKSVVMLQATAAAIADGKRVVVVSLELDAEDIAARIIANLRSVPMDTFKRPKAAARECLIRAKAGLDQLAEMPLVIDDRGGRSLDQIAGIVQSEVDRSGAVDLVVVDYIQLIEGRRAKNETREQEVAGFSRGLKALAKKFRVPVFTASQLNDNGRLRESRAIGQDADVVLAIEEEGIRGLKVRNGVRGQLYPLRLNGEFQRFELQRFEERRPA